MQVDAQLLPAINQIISATEIQLRKLIGINISLRLELHNTEINEAYIQTLVCSYFGVAWKDITGTSRECTIKNARFVYCWLCIQWLRKSLTSIGKDVNRDHTSIIHARDTIKDLLQAKDEVITKAIAYIETKMRQ